MNFKLPPRRVVITLSYVLSAVLCLCALAALLYAFKYDKPLMFLFGMITWIVTAGIVFFFANTIWKDKSWYDPKTNT